MAFTRLVVDGHSAAEIAMDLQLPESEVMRMVAAEHRERARAGTSRHHGQELRWVVVGEEQQTCDHHGHYMAQRMELQPKPHRPDWARPAVEDFLAPWLTRCPHCDRIWQAEADAKDAEIRSGVGLAEQFLLMRMEAAGIPTRFAGSTVFGWIASLPGQQRVLRWAKDWIGNLDTVLQTGRSGGFCGAPGTGKTHLAVGMLRYVLEKGGTGCYTTVMDMLGRIKATFHRDAEETEQRVVDDLTRCDLLVVDEVGRSLDTNYEIAQFFRVLDLRYRNVRPVILVSNLPVARLREHLGDAVCDRLREAGGAVLVFDWASQRAQKIAPTA